MKVEIKMKVTNKAINALAGVLDSGLERISTDHHTIVFETQQPQEWLSEERKIAFEEEYNKELGDENIYYFVDKISITN